MMLTVVSAKMEHSESLVCSADILSAEADLGFLSA